MAGFLGWVFDQVMRKPMATFDKGLFRPFATQEQTLRRILQKNLNTEFGKNHDFTRMLQVPGPELWKHYRKTVPIRTYEDFAPEIERMKQGEENVLIPGRPDMFSLTSGTTSAPKFCPVNRSFIKEHHSQHLLWMYQLYRDHPACNSGKYLVAASPAEMGRTAGGIPYGAMSGKQLETQSIPVRRRQAVPVEVQRLESAEDRWFNVLLFALAEKDLRVITSVNPSTLVALANRLDRDIEPLLECLAKGHPYTGRTDIGKQEESVARLFKPRPDRARELREIIRTDGSLLPASAWPNVEVILTWQGGASGFYLPHVAALWGNTAQRCLGLRASEGTFTIPYRDHSPSGVVALGGHAIEFVPEESGDPKDFSPTLLAGQLEKGGLYRLIITTSGGFYRYDMGDLVRVTGFFGKTPEVAFERRAGSILSATGEKVTENQVVKAMELAAADGPLLNGFSLTYEMVDGVARYVLALELAGGDAMLNLRSSILSDRLTQLLAVFDDELMHRNIEYQGKRDDGRLAFPRIIFLAEGSYDAYRARQAASGKPENQVKQPILIRPERSGPFSESAGEFFRTTSIVNQFTAPERIVYLIKMAARRAKNF